VRDWAFVTTALSITCLPAVLVPRAAHAEDLRAHATLGGAHAVGAPQVREFGLGVSASGAVELPLGARVGVEAKLSATVLTEGDAPLDPRFAKRSAGTAWVGTLGVRLRPFTAEAGPWVALGAGGAQTGDRARVAFDTALGWDFRVTRVGRLDLGPYAGLTGIVQADDALSPNDAYVVSLGIHVGLGHKIPKPSDRDHDGISDPVDACPDVPGLATSDPKTNGCPRGDRDEDGVFDDEDACPDVAGKRTNDPATNGCPESDRDHDTILDRDDACPDVPGIATSDPKTNGCPPRGDRDEDGVFDDEDACPDVPGARTEDPKTNGCPADDTVHVERDRILFDEVILYELDSPRVRHASWGIIKKLADFISATPTIEEVSIEGHADATGTVAHNLRLSRDRAEAVRRLLVQFGVNAERLKAEAFGRSRLKVQTQHAEAQNRRVEFWITRTRGGVTVPTTDSPIPLPKAGDAK
jgi:outer membrane protein OmpA-like peptidoglycan-associated protein